MLLYLSFTIATLYGFYKLKYKKSELSTSIDRVTIIVAFKNEENNLPVLIKSLVDQSCQQFDVLLIDDNSTDNSYYIANNLTSQLKNFSLYKNNSSSKKRAIEQAISLAKTSGIITTDADCIIPNNWIQTIINSSVIVLNDMVIMPVLMTPANNSFLSHFQCNDYAALQMTTVGMAGINNEIMCSGANLYFTKQLYNSCKLSLCFEQLSGDDMFLMLEAKRQNYKISYLLNSYTAVKTPSEIGLTNFINQRIRWGSKAKHYSDKGVITVGLITIITYLFLWINIIESFIIYKNLNITVAFFIIITICNYSLIKIFLHFFKQQNRIKYFFLSQLFYILYFPLITLLSFIGKYKWKQTKVKRQ